MEGEMATHNILSVTRVVAPRGDYPGTYRVLIETVEEGNTELIYEHVNGLDELDAARRVRKWVDSEVYDYERAIRKAVNSVSN